ncbi:hypothetical protein OAN21_00215 [Alphaproteobacteria bacterium]|nr:hypothetical protein [Alphaproteobacteria bacterium]
MFKKVLSFMFLAIASMASVTDQEVMPSMKKKILVLGVAHHDNDRTPLPEGNLLLAKKTELRETVDLFFLDQCNEGKGLPFVYADFDDQALMESFSSKYEGCFDEIHFDWSVLKFLKLENHFSFSFSSIYKSLKHGGLFYLPDVGLPVHFLSKDVSDLRMAARMENRYEDAEQIVKTDRQEQESVYVGSLEERLREAGFSVEKTTERDIETSVFFEPIRIRIQSMKKYIDKPGDVIEGFPVWIAKKQ